MPRVVCLVLLAALATRLLAASPPAATRVTPVELEELLAGLHDKGDARAARELASMELTERVGAAQLARWQAELHGKRAEQAILALADVGAFLDPPPAENLPAKPDASTATQIVGRMIDYVKQMVPRLPNFSALRSTTAFEIATEAQLNAPRISGVLQSKPSKRPAHEALGAAKSSGLPNAQLFWVGSFARIATYRDGVEVSEGSAALAGQPGTGSVGMATAGEFGAILRVVLDDAPQDKIVWDHWEQGEAAPLAIFRYAVPRDRSHFAIEWPTEEESDHPAYHGEVAVDPASGTIYRITVETSGTGPGFLQESSILVEFGPTQIGGVTYICPIRGVALVKDFDSFANLDAQPPPIPFHTAINDVSFTNYHVFRTKSRVMTDPGNP